MTLINGEIARVTAKLTSVQSGAIENVWWLQKTVGANPMSIRNASREFCRADMHRDGALLPPA